MSRSVRRTTDAVARSSGLPPLGQRTKGTICGGPATSVGTTASASGCSAKAPFTARIGTPPERARPWASARGFLDATMGNKDALNQLGIALAGHHRMIRCCVVGQQKVLVQRLDIERRLLEFTHARRHGPTEATPNMVRLKNIQDYLAVF